MRCESLSSDDASTTGAALAFYCAFSLAPLLVILLTIAGAVVGAETAYGQVGEQLTALFGQSTAKVILDAVRSSQQFEGLVSTVVSAVTLLIGASTVLAALDTALEKIWRTEKLLPTGLRGWVRTRLLSFGFILALGFLLLVSLTISTALSNLRGWVARRLRGNSGTLLACSTSWRRWCWSRCCLRSFTDTCRRAARLANGDRGRRSDGGSVQYRPMGYRVVSSSLDAALGLRGCSIFRGFASLAVLHGTNLPFSERSSPPAWQACGTSQHAPSHTLVDYCEHHRVRHSAGHGGICC